MNYKQPCWKNIQFESSQFDRVGNSHETKQMLVYKNEEITVQQFINPEGLFN